MAHRTAMITAGSIALVITAAAVAVGANLGILNAADSRPVGTLSASAAAPSGAPKVVTVSAGGTKAATAQTDVTQKYVIRKAGRVSVAATKSGLRLVDVSTRHGWHWSLQQTADKKLTVTFRSGSTTYKFLAVLGRHGTIVARVDHPVTKVVPSAPSASVVAWSPARAAAPAVAAPTTSHSDESGNGGGGADD